MIMQVSVLWRCTSLISPLFFSVAFIQRTNVRGGYGNSWGKFFFFFLSFNFCDVSRATWKRHLNPYTAKVHDGVFLVCGQNPVVLPSKWNLCSGTFTWYYYFSVFHKLKQRILRTKSNHAVWSFKWNLFCSIFTWYFLFFSVVQSEITLCFFGSVRLIIMFRVYELICPRCRSFPWTHLLKKLFNMCFSEGRQAFVSFTIFTETIMHFVSPPPPHRPPKKFT